MTTELLLDPSIRIWVFLPIVVITFLVGVARHYLALLMTSRSKATLEQIQDGQWLARARALRENGRLLPRASYQSRKWALCNEENGYLAEAMKRKTGGPNPMDPTHMTDMLKGNMLNMIPMIVIGGWINWTFSGFVSTRVPFPLTLRFKQMLQRGIALDSLDASWVSSASWYFLCVFGMRSIYTLVLGEDNSADQSRAMEEQMTGPAAAPPDARAAAKAEWEALHITAHHFELAAQSQGSRE